MSSIWLNSDHARIRSFGANVKGVKAVVKIEIEVSDLSYLGYLLDDVARAQCELREPRADHSKLRRAPDELDHQELLAIPDMRGRP